MYNLLALGVMNKPKVKYFARNKVAFSCFLGWKEAENQINSSILPFWCATSMKGSIRALTFRIKTNYMLSSTFFQQRSYAKAGLLAIPLIICMLVMGQHFPKGEVLGYKSKIIAFEFVKSEAEVRGVLDALSVEELAGMDRGNYIDFAFMLCYGAFVSFFFLLAYRQLGAKWLQVGILLGRIWRWISGPFLIPFALSMIAIVGQVPTWIERFTRSIFVGLGSWILCCFFVRRT